MNTPTWYQLLLLALAAYRTWRLIAEDDITDKPRRWFLRLGDWREEGDPIPLRYRRGVGSFLACAWCFGAWITLAWWIAYEIWNEGTVIVAVPFAISALVGIVRAKLDPPE